MYQQSLFEIWENPQVGDGIPWNARAMGLESGSFFESGHRLTKKQVGEPLAVYRPECRFEFDELKVTSWITEQTPNGATAWCDLELAVVDPAADHSALADEHGVVTLPAVENWIRPRIEEVLERIGQQGELVNEQYWPQVAERVCDELSMPRGLLPIRFVLRKVRSLGQLVEERRMKASFLARLQQVIDDGTLQTMASEGRIRQLLADLETSASGTSNTAEEQRQEALDLATSSSGGMTEVRELLQSIRDAERQDALRLWCDSKRSVRRGVIPVPRCDSRAFRVGDKIDFRLWCKHDGYLRVLVVQSDGAMVPLFPNEYCQDYHVDGGSEFVFPTTEMRFDYRIVEPVGIDVLLAIGSTKLFALDKNAVGEQGDVALCSEDTVRLLRRTREQVAAGVWSCAQCQIVVQR